MNTKCLPFCRKQNMCDEYIDNNDTRANIDLTNQKKLNEQDEKFEVVFFLKVLGSAL